MRRDYPFRRQFRYENFDGEKYTPGVQFGQADTDTQVAGLFGYSDDEIERRKVLSDIINKPGYDPKSVTEAQRQLLRLNQGNPAIKTADLIYAGGNINLSKKVKSKSDIILFLFLKFANFLWDFSIIFK